MDAGAAACRGRGARRRQHPGGGRAGRPSKRLPVSARERIDAGGGSVLPGFIESHIHLFAGGAQLDSLSLAGLTGFDRIAAAIRERAAARSRRSSCCWSSRRPIRCSARPSRSPGSCSTGSCPDRPLALFASDHHTMWANTAALQAAGLLQGRATPPGSEVVMGADGLGDRRTARVRGLRAGVRAGADRRPRDARPARPRAGDAADGGAARRRQRHVCGAGWPAAPRSASPASTTWTAMLPARAAGRDRPRRGAARALHASRSACCRDMELGPLDEARRDAGALELRPAEGGFRQDLHGRRHRIDHRLHARRIIAACRASAARPSSSQDEFDAVCIEARSARLADRRPRDRRRRRSPHAQRLRGGATADGRRDSRHRIEHIEMLDPADLPRFAELGVIASMQPTHAPGGAYPIEPIASMRRPPSG